MTEFDPYRASLHRSKLTTSRFDNNVAPAPGRSGPVARELLRNEPPHAFVGWHISVVDEQGVVVFKVPL
jgi:hypothetical protein